MHPDSVQQCVKRDIEEERKELPDFIYLIPESNGEFGDYWAWCDVPDPTNDHIASEAVKYERVI